MAITTVPLFAFPSTENLHVTGTGSQALTASTHIVGFLVQAPVTGTINGIKFRTGTVTTGDTLRVSFQAVDVATGNPNGTAAQYRSITIANADDNVSVSSGLITSDGTDLGTKRSVTQGDWFFVCFDYPSYVAGSMQIANITYTNNIQSYQSYYNGSTWTKTASVSGNFLFEYATLGIVPGLSHALFSSGSETGTFNNTSTPDERANKFQVPVSVRVVGVTTRADFDGECEIILYASDGTTVLASVAIDPDARSLTDRRTYMHLFGSSVTLSPSTNYYLALKPTTATSVGYTQLLFFTSGDRAGTHFGINWTLSTRTDGGSWTDDNTRQLMASLLCDGIDSGGAGGGVPLIGPGGLVY